MLDSLHRARTEAISKILGNSDKSSLEEIRIEYLGRNGRINQEAKVITSLSKEEKVEFGRALNEAKKAIEEALGAALNERESIELQNFDPTIPGITPPLGSTHLISQAIEEISSIFTQIGFTRRRYPEIETDWYAFEGLNMPKDHPARDEQETFFVEGGLVLTPHTSSGQLREMGGGKPPIRMINIGKTYRRQSDLTHIPMFHQFEGLVIDEGLSISNLLGTLDYFAKNFFGEKREIRLRPYNFRFTEPSFEVDISCDVCSGKGCKFCKQGWLELGGAGMVHPNVLTAGGLDHKKFRGFAFGWGVERTYMMKSGIKLGDIRTILSTDIRHLSQF